MSKKAALAPCETVAQFVIRQLLAGIKVQVQVGLKVYEGLVHQLDFGPGQDKDCVFAWVHVPALDEPEGTKSLMDIKVAIRTNGEVTVLPESPAPERESGLIAHAVVFVDDPKKLAGDKSLFAVREQAVQYQNMWNADVGACESRSVKTVPMSVY